MLLGGRAVPVFLAAGLVGLAGGTCLHLALAAIGGLSLGVALAVQALACIGFVSFGLFRRWLTGGERTVLLEHVLLALALSSGLVFALGAPVRAHLDALVAGLCVFLACGRVGCTAAGCCYGRPSSFGIRYPDGHPAHPHRRFPVQLVASAVWATLAGLSSIVSLAGSPGAATGVVLVAYAGIRVVLEAQRGDPRPRWAGLSSAEWLAVPMVLVGVWAAGGGPFDLALAAMASAAFGVLWSQRRRWLRLRPPIEPHQLDAAMRLGRELAGTELSSEVRRWTIGGLSLAASVVDDAVLISIDRPSGGLVDAEAALLFDAIGFGAGVPLGRPARRGAFWSVLLPFAPTPAPEQEIFGDRYLSRTGGA
ncbi:MAG: prolipoprotein diacylglyceryl transferase [Alphaproteobacteria bacterium]|nr:prolipoprotein diacylglyceryl transferase [Alphaproteobacteria bacterium]